MLPVHASSLCHGVFPCRSCFCMMWASTPTLRHLLPPALHAGCSSVWPHGPVARSAMRPALAVRWVLPCYKIGALEGVSRRSHTPLYIAHDGRYRRPPSFLCAHVPACTRCVPQSRTLLAHACAAILACSALPRRHENSAGGGAATLQAQQRVAALEGARDRPAPVQLQVGLTLLTCHTVLPYCAASHCRLAWMQLQVGLPFHM